MPPETVPTAGYTPPIHYISDYADHFDLSLLPADNSSTPTANNAGHHIRDDDQDVDNDLDLEHCSDRTLLRSDPTSSIPSIFLEVPPASTDYRCTHPSSPDLSLYAPSPTSSIYSRSPCDYDFSYAHQQYHSLMVPKQEEYGPTSPASTIYSNLSSPGEQLRYSDVVDLLESVALDQTVAPATAIKQETTSAPSASTSPVDFGNILLAEFHQEEQPPPPITGNHHSSTTTTTTTKDHQLLRQALRDTTFQRRYNIKPVDLTLVLLSDVKMEEPDLEDEHCADLIINNKDGAISGTAIDGGSSIGVTENGGTEDDDLMTEDIEPVLNLAIEQMKRDVNCTCAALQISPDPLQWTFENVVSWLQWTSRQFGLEEIIAEQWKMLGSNLVQLTEEDFIRRSPQGGMILHAQLEVWKAAYSDEDLSIKWPNDVHVETASSNASSSADVSDVEDEENPMGDTSPARITTTIMDDSTAGVVVATGTSGSRTLSSNSTTTSTTTITTNNNSNATSGTHIHLWQFLKELLGTPQTHGTCIRWMDRTKGIFKIEDSVKVARLWGKRKNRPAMNYDKLSRSIRQYYKKGIMKKTERSQRLVYQFCHPYNL